MTQQERDLLIGTCLLMTNYAKEFFDRLTDAELERFYDEQISKKCGV